MTATVSRSAIVAEARSWLGTPYAHLQRQKGRYTDCVGLIIGVARAFGLGDYRRRDYSRIPDPAQMRRELSARLNPVPTDHAEPGDILWMAYTDPATRERIPRHLGLLAEHPEGGRSIIHAWAEAGRVVEHRLDTRWQRRLCGAFRFPGVDD